MLMTPWGTCHAGRLPRDARVLFLNELVSRGTVLVVSAYMQACMPGLSDNRSLVGMQAMRNGWMGAGNAAWCCG